MAGLDESLRSGAAEMCEFQGTDGRPELSEALLDMWDTKEFSDLTIRAKGTQIKAHKFLLKAYCTKLTSEDLAETTLKLDIPSNIMNIILAYIYTNKVSVVKDDLKQVAQAANDLGVKELHKQCMRRYLKTITINRDNALKIWIDAKEAGQEDISEEALSVALKQFVKIQKTDSFKALPAVYLKSYVSHPDLAVRTADERLSSSLIWIRVDNKRRHHLRHILDVLPQGDMSPWFLDHLLEDPLIQQQPQIVQRIQEMQEGVSDRHRQKGDAGQDGEKCLVFAGAKINDSVSSDVYAVQVQNNFKVVRIGSIGATFKDGGGGSCLYKNTLYVTGVSEEYDQIWSFSLDTRQATQCAKLVCERQYHSTTAGSDGNIYTMAGREYDYDWHLVCSVERYNISSGVSKEVDDDLPLDWCRQCRSCLVDGKIILCGTMDSDDYQQIIVWDTATCRTKHTIRIQSPTNSYVYGVSVCQGYLVVIAQWYTAVCLVDDILNGREDKVKLSKHYQTPNNDCGMITSPDDQTLYLVGGYPKSDKPQQYIYQASVSDLVQDTAKGWTPVTGTDWSLGKCRLWAGAASAYVKL